MAFNTQVHAAGLRAAGGPQRGDPVHAGARRSVHRRHRGHSRRLHSGHLQGLHGPQGFQGEEAAPHEARAATQGRRQVRHEQTTLGDTSVLV